MAACAGTGTIQTQCACPSPPPPAHLPPHTLTQSLRPDRHEPRPLCPPLSCRHRKLPRFVRRERAPSVETPAHAPSRRSVKALPAAAYAARHEILALLQGKGGVRGGGGLVCGEEKEAPKEDCVHAWVCVNAGRNLRKLARTVPPPSPHVYRGDTCVYCVLEFRNESWHEQCIRRFSRGIYDQAPRSARPGCDRTGNHGAT
jgi:hypothetical protein